MHTARIHDTSGTHARGLFRAALVAGAVFLAWKLGRGVRDLAWGAVGLGFAAYWTGLWPF